MFCGDGVMRPNSFEKAVYIMGTLIIPIVGLLMDETSVLASYILGQLAPN